MAVKFDPGKRDCSLVLWRRHDGVDLARERRLDGPAGEGERSTPARGIGNAERKHSRVWLRTGEHIELAACPIRIGNVWDDPKLGSDGACLGVADQQIRVAHQDGIAGGPHRGIERSFDSDLWPNTGRVPGGNGDLCFVAHLRRGAPYNRFTPKA